MDWIETELRALAETRRLRTPTRTHWVDATRVRIGAEVLRAFCGNDYLGLRHHPVLRAAAQRALITEGSGTGASRMVSGNLGLHEITEHSLADFVHAEAAMLASSGYALNVGTLSALLGSEDLVLSDVLNHASLIDGIRLSRARVIVHPHLDLAAVREGLRTPARRRWVVTESLFSMDGDSPDLPALRAITHEAGAHLYVDEAHALGVFGHCGRGLCAQSEIRPDVLVGTLGKSLGSAGAFVAGSHRLREWLWNRCRAHVFSTGMSPANTAAAQAAVELLTHEGDLPKRLHTRLRTLRTRLERAGITPGGRPESPILPMIVGDDAKALALAQALRHQGFFVQAIRPPTVPEGSARLRVTVSAAHTEEDLEDFARAVISLWR